MDWGRAVDLYCERTDASFWAEPFNAVTNAAFLIAALVAFVQWRRCGVGDWSVLALIGVTAAIGVGSFIFHTVATSGAAKFDTIPIALFIYGYLLLALRRYLGFSLLVSLGALVAFSELNYAEAAIVPRGALNGSHAYLPALTALVAVAWPVRREQAGRLLFAATFTLVVSLVFRSIDMAVCDALPLGTHFLWHSLNGLALYLLLRAAMVGRAGI
ncbi:MAG: ceramidase domain-containing protein [Hyphomicrobiales bacterium]|nr:ceramidase domain-containing protein [Hyphomicrobiales bacterium]